MFVECFAVTNSNIMLTPYHAYVNGYCRYWLYLIPFGCTYYRNVPVDSCFANTRFDDSLNEKTEAAGFS
jgi:hypothetical protein